MSPEPPSGGSPVQLDTGTRLAYERTFLAHERTQMAWIRTALTLISFGFTISKFFELLQQKQGEMAPLLGPRTVGVTMIAMGLVALILASIQHYHALEKLRERCPDLPRSLSWVIAMMLALIGLAALVHATVRI